MTKQFPNIPDNRQSVVLDIVMTRMSLERPDLLRRWQESVHDLADELGKLLKKRNDTPDLVTDAEKQRAREINDEMRDQLLKICGDDIRAN